MHTTQPVRPRLDERVKVSITPDDKRRLFETAAARGVTVSQLCAPLLLRSPPR
jgi:hypothetical protein